jgi:hypothetical protein
VQSLHCRGFTLLPPPRRRLHADRTHRPADVAVDYDGQRKRVAHMPTATTAEEDFENRSKSPTRLHEEAQK